MKFYKNIGKYSRHITYRYNTKQYNHYFRKYKGRVIAIQTLPNRSASEGYVLTAHTRFIGALKKQGEKMGKITLQCRSTSKTGVCSAFSKHGTYIAKIGAFL